jgi:hypothetical protein
MCKGDSHTGDGNVPFDHIEPVWGLYSNHDLSDPEIYGDDYLQFGSGYSPDGKDNLGYFRTFNSMVDTVDMNGNCKDAQAPHGLNEAYPCYNDQENFGVALKGLIDPGNVTIPSSLWVSSWQEPNVRTGSSPLEMSAWLNVETVKEFSTYNVYMFNSIEDYPLDSNFKNAKYNYTE